MEISTVLNLSWTFSIPEQACGWIISSSFYSLCFCSYCFLATIFLQEWTSPVYASQNHFLDVHLCHNELNKWYIKKGLTTNPSIYCFHLVISSLSTLNQLSIHRATFLTTSWLQMVVLIWRGERGGPETSGNIWTSGSDTPSHLALFHPLRSRSRAQALLRSHKPSSHTPTQPPSDTDGSWARGKGCVWLLSQDIDMI